MKALKPFLFTLACIVSTANAQIPTNGLIAHFPFDGNADDISESNHRATANNTQHGRDRFGIQYRAYYFDGATSNVDVEYEYEELFQSEYSVAMWVNPSSTQAVIAKLLCFPYQAYNWVYPYHHLALSFANPALDTYRFSASSYYESGAPSYANTESVSPNVWQFLVFTFDQGVVKFYVDNVLVETGTFTQPELFFPEFGFSIGSRSMHPDYNGEFYKGYIDDLRLYGRALQTSEISALYNDNYSISPTDSLALVSLYNATQGDLWDNNTNWLIGPVYTWYGIKVANRSVIEISLGDNNLNGIIPSEIGNLTELQNLSLQINQLDGPMPMEIFSLSKLRILNLQSNHITGSISSQINNLANLSYLDFSVNDLTGPIPEEIGNEINLVYLNLKNNRLTGPIPKTIMHLWRLQQLDLSQNLLTGNIPVGISILNDLIILNLYSNQLSGSIPSLIGHMSGLKYIELSANKLSGTIPSTFGFAESLIRFDLEGNQLTGPIPGELGNLANLEELYLAYNKLSGPLPNGFANLSKLASMTLNANFFTFGDLQNSERTVESFNWFYYSPQGEIAKPTETSSGENIILQCITDGTGNEYQWYKDGISIPEINSNNLIISKSDTGIYYCEVTNSTFPDLTLFTLPYFYKVENSNGVILQDYNALTSLYISTNGDEWTNSTNWISAEDVASWFGIDTEHGQVISIDLQTNHLTGSLPVEIGDFSKLQVLKLYDNVISGNIPEEVYDLTSLKELWLRENKLEGQISPRIENLLKLETLELRKNSLNGTIPSEIGLLPVLQGINLSQTHLEGSIPTSFNKLLNLNYLYLYETDLNDIPDLSTLTNLNSFYIDSSKFTFEDFITSGLDFSSIATLKYAPQDTLTLNTHSLEVKEGDEFNIGCRDLLDEDLWSTDNEFAFYIDGEISSTWSGQGNFILESFTSAWEGNYTIHVKNDLYPSLILVSDTLKVSVYIAEAPTDITISTDAIEENVPLGTLVGILSSDDPNEGDTHSYSFATGDGSNDADNASFTIDGSNLLSATALDYETKYEYFIRIKSQDDEGLSIVKDFTISVTNVIEVGLDDVSKVSISIYPNPSKGILTIETDEIESHIEVFDMIGHKIYEQLSHSNKETIDLSDKSKGSYIIKIRQKDKVYFKKITII